MKLDRLLIKERALRSKRRVFNVKDLVNLLNTTEENARVYIERVVKRKLATKVARGIIAFTDNDYIIANQLIEPSYISMNSALHYLGLILQVPNTIEVICANQVKIKTQYTYYKLNPKLIFGYTKELAEETYYFVAEPEKAVIDLIYFHGFSELYLKDILPKLDLPKLRKYIKKYLTIPGYRSKRVIKMGEYIDKQRRIIKNRKTK